MNNYLFLSQIYINVCYTCHDIFLGVLMSRSKYATKTSSDNPNFVSQTTAAILSKAGIIDYCLTLLQALLDYWKT